MNYSIRHYSKIMAFVIATGIIIDALLFFHHPRLDISTEHIIRIGYFFACLVFLVFAAILASPEPNAKVFYYTDNYTSNNLVTLIITSLFFLAIALCIIFLEKKTKVGSMTGLAIAASGMAMLVAVLTGKRRVEIGPGYIVIFDKSTSVIERYKVKSCTMAGDRIIIDKPIKKGEILFSKFDPVQAQALFYAVQEWCVWYQVPFR